MARTQSALTTKILSIVRELLYNDAINEHDDLFDIGLNSISATQLMSRLQRETGIEIGLHQVFDELESDVFSVTTLVSIAAKISIPGEEKIRTIPARELYDVSFVQRRLWLIEKYNGGKHPSSIPIRIIFNQALNVPALETACRTLLQRHESLRTQYVDRDDAVYQRINPDHEASFKIAFTDLSAVRKPDVTLKSIAVDEARYVFDLSSEILLKVKVVKEKEDRFHCFFTVHHIASDGWSTSILLKELFHIYDCLLAGAPVTLAALDLTYKDYAAWYNERIESRREQNRKFWLEYLNEDFGRSLLPSYRQRPAVKAYHGKRLSFAFPPEVSRSLISFAARQDATLFNALISLLTVVLYRYTNDRKIVFGTSVANRAFGGLENIVGYFLSVIPIKTEIDPEMTFRELLAGTTRNIGQAYKHQEYPFDALVNDLGANRDPGFSPIFDTVVLLHNYENPILAEHETRGARPREIFETDNETCIVDLFLEFFQSRNALTLNVRYDTGVYEGPQITLFFEHFLRVVTEVLHNPGKKISSYVMLTPRELHRLRAVPAPEGFPAFGQVIDAFRDVVNRCPGHTAIRQLHDRVSYRELESMSDAIAAHLRHELNCLPGDIVAVVMSRSTEMIALLLAIWKCDCVYLPVDPATPAGRIEEIIADARPKALLFDEPAKAVSNSRCGHLVLHCCDISATRAGRHAGAAPRPAGNDPDRPAYLIYTSGSTGSPKGAVVHHRGMVNHLKTKISVLALGETSVVAQNASQGFDISIWQMVAPLLTGGSVFIIDQPTVLDPERLAGQVAQKKVTHLEVVPSYLLALIELTRPTDLEKLFATLACVLVTGETVAAELTQLWFRHCPAIPLVNAFGPTEASDDITHHRMEAPVYERVPIGTPIPNARVYVLDGNRLPCPEGVTGDLFVGGQCVGLGYLNLPEKTAEVFIPDPVAPGAGLVYNTGDRARFLPDGTLDFRGRKDNQVKINGHRIELEEVEQRVRKILDVGQVAVVLDRSAGQPLLLAFIQGPVAIDAGHIREKLGQFLPEQLLPARIEVLEKLPLTANGKVDRAALLRDADTTPEKISAPATAIEETLTGLWKEVLRIESVGVTDNFFRLGGYSLLANQLVLRIHRALRVKLDLRQVFTHPTIRKLAGLVLTGKKSEYVEPHPVEDQDHYAVSHAQKRLWILNQLRKDQVAYNVYGAYACEGHVSIDKLTKAMARIVARHQSLRTVFPLIHSIPVQKVVDYLEPASYLKVRNVSDAADPQSVSEYYLAQSLRTPFDLERGPLFRIEVCIIQPDVLHLFLVLHHIISDGWSRGVLEQELWSIYAALEAERPVLLPDLSLQYRDYSAWQNGAIAGGHLSAQKNYWKRLLRARPAKGVDLPLSRPRPAVLSFNGASRDFVLSGPAKEVLSRFCKEHGITLFMSIVSVMFVWLYRVTGQRNLTLGATLAGRAHRNLENLIGFFVNTLPLCYHVNPGSRAGELVADVRQRVAEMLAHDEYPFDLLVEELNLERDLSRNAVFDVLVEVHQFDNREPVPGAKGIGFSPTPFSIPEVSSIYDLNFIVTENPDSLALHVRYNTDLFTHEQIGQFAASLEALAIEFATHTDQEIGALKLPGFVEEPAPAGLPAPVDTTVSRLIDRVAGQKAGATAIVAGNRQVSYRELASGAGRLANLMRATGSAAPIVGVLLERGPAMVEAILGIWKCGKGYLPLDGELPLSRLSFIIEDAAIETLIFSKQYVKPAQILLWNAPKLRHLICVDDDDVQALAEPENESMKRELWEYVGATAADEIQGGGWLSSYTGAPFSKEEMDEYAGNAVQKLMPYLGPGKSVLEIGCASGLTMFAVAPLVGKYTGTDLSRTIIERNAGLVAARGITNIELHCLYADEIDQLGDCYDVIVINSVVQNFNGYNYLYAVLDKCLARLRGSGVIFIGDVMDAGRKSALIRSLVEFSKAGPAEVVKKTKLDWDDELFLPQAFFEDLPARFNVISDVVISDKVFSIRNELTEFRYDVLLEVQKSKPLAVRKPLKTLYDRSHLRACEEVSENLSSPGGIAYVIYTSGSTGQPKGAVIEHAGMYNHIMGKIEKLQLTGERVVAQNASHCFDISVWQFFAPLAAGGSVVIYANDLVRDVPGFWQAIGRDGVHVLEVVPTYLNEILHLVQHEQLSPAALSLRFLMATGEALSRRTVSKWFEVFPEIPLINAYGPTEASDDVTHYTLLHAPEDDNIPIGFPLPNVHLRIVNAEGQACPPGVKGELCVAGVAVGRGYLNNPEKTHDRFYRVANADGSVSRAYRTGDIAMRNPDGSYSMIGREDHQVKIRGHRIELGEIEQKLLQLPGIEEAVALAVPEDDTLSIEAFIRGTNGMGPVTELKGKLARRLPQYMIPAAFHCIDPFPVTANGKIDRKKLLGLRQRSTQAPEAMSATEQAVAAMWKQVLNREIPGTDANFFDIGGHSLKATRLSTTIQKELKVKISLRDIFLHPTVRALAHLIEATNVSAVSEIPVAPAADSYELSHAQKRIWVLSQFEGGLQAYSERGALEISAALDESAFATAVHLLVKRHEILRTVFVNVDGEPRQKVHDWNQSLSELLIREYTRAGRAWSTPEIQEQVESEPYPFFDLATGPLIRFSLLKFGPARYVFLFDAHHIICDGWSGRVFINDVLALYHAASLSGPPPLQPLRIQYKDFARWSNRLVESTAFADHKRFWEKTLRGAPVLALPASYPRPEVFTYRGETAVFSLGEHVYPALLALSKANGCTLFTTLTSLLNVLFFHYTDDTDIVIGTSVAGRDVADLTNQIGFYLNTVAIRNRINADDTFALLLGNVKANVLQALEHQQYPFDVLVQDLKLKRDLSRSALFDVLLELQNFDGVLTEDAGVALLDATYPSRLLNVPKPVSQVDMNWSFAEQGDRLLLAITFNTDIYSRELVDQYARHFENLAAAVCREPLRRIREYDIVTETDLPASCSVGENVAVGSKPFIRLFEEMARLAPNAVAVTDHEQSLTYGGLDFAARQFAGKLLEGGCRPGDRIAVLQRRSGEYLKTLLGIFKAGCVYVPIDPKDPLARIIDLLRDCTPAALVISADLVDTPLEQALPAIGSLRFILARDRDGLRQLRFRSAVQASPGEIRPVSTGDIAYVIYTSGSTGKPKGAMVGQWGMLNHLQSKVGVLNLTSASVVAQNASQSFDISIWQFLAPLIVGGRVVVIDHALQLEVPRFVDVLRRERVTVLEMVPSYLRLFLDAGIEGLSLQFLVSTGEELKPQLANHALKKLGRIKILNAYGPTEASDDVTHYEMADPVAGVVPIGKAVQNFSIYVVNRRSLKICAPGVQGEILVAGDGVGAGYLNDPEKTAHAFIPNPFSKKPQRAYRTGDVGVMLPDGNVGFLGRYDEQVKINGYRIETSEVERKIECLEGVDEAVVKTFTEESGGKFLCAFVRSSQWSGNDVDSVKGGLRRLVPDYLIPARWVFMPAFPLTANGKIDRRALTLPVEAADLLPDFAHAQTHEEKVLTGIWEEIFDRKFISVNDDFFELGGDSIKAIQVASKTFKEGFALEIKDLFQHTTIKQLATHLTGRKRTDQRPVEGLVPLSPSQLEFFEQHRDNPNHYNLALLLDVDHLPAPDRLAAIVNALIHQHDALRINFHDEGEVRQVSKGTNHAIPAPHFDLSGSAGWQQQLERIAAGMQASFDIRSTALMQCAAFTVPHGARVLFIVHHLVFDGVSWRILLEDFEQLVQQARRGEPLRLPEKTSSFKAWTESLWQFTNTPAFLPEVSYWRNIDHSPADRIPVRPLARDVQSDTVLHAFKVDEGITGALAGGRNKRGTELKDSLITAIAMALQAMFGTEHFRLMLESHGRNNLELEHLQLSRTIGWFSCDFPVAFRLDHGWPLAQKLATVREHVATVPRDGIGYLAYRHMYQAGAARSEPGARPQVRFNYMGQFSVDRSRSQFGISNENTGLIRDGRQMREYDLELSAVVLQGELGFEIAYNRHGIDAGVIARLAEEIAGALQKISALSPDDPGDGFTYGDLNYEDLDAIKSLIG